MVNIILMVRALSIPNKVSNELMSNNVPIIFIFWEMGFWGKGLIWNEK